VQDVIFSVPYFAKVLLRNVSYQYVFLKERSAGMKIRNKKKFQYGIPTYTSPYRALSISLLGIEVNGQQLFAYCTSVCLLAHGHSCPHTHSSSPLSDIHRFLNLHSVVVGVPNALKSLLRLGIAFTTLEEM
jgi:hypothetical protein